MQMEKGKAWQSNASTGWLAGITGRVSQRFVNSIISQLYVSASALPETVDNWKYKTDLLRSVFTTLVRSWNGYTGLINAECSETVFQGYAYCVFLDPYTWKPTFFKQDWAFVPEFSGQHARDLQFFVAKIDYRLDEFIALFRDESAAEEVGYDLENCVWAANHATMRNPGTDAQTTQYRSFVEMYNHGTLGLAYSSTGPRVVNCYLLFNREYDGKVSFWLIDRESGKQLRFSFKLFKNMEDAIAIFSFVAGDGCIHSSKGIGRLLANLTVMKELFRNGIIDNSRISGLLILRVDSKDKTMFQPAILSPFVMVDKGVDIPTQQFQANGETYKIVDQLIDAWAEQAVGAYITQQLDPQGKTEKTATEAQIDARRETEAADIQIRRQLDQFSTLTQIMQLRAFSDDNIDDARRIYDEITEDPAKDESIIYDRKGDDPEVMRALVQIMTAGITDDEIKQWRDSPASMFAHVAEAALQQGIAAAALKYKGDPNIDQSQLAYRDIEGMVGADEAKKLFIPKAMTTLPLESSRKQEIETFVMAGSGQPQAVSPRDQHMLEIPTIIEFLTNAAAPLLSRPDAPPQALKAAELNLNHMGSHLQYASQDPMTNKLPALKEFSKFFDGFKKQLAQVVQIQAQAAAAHDAVLAKVRQESGMVPPPNGTTPAVAPALPNGAPPPTALNSATAVPAFALPSIPARTAPTREPAAA